MAARSLPSGLTRGAAMTELHCLWVIVLAGWYEPDGSFQLGLTGAR